jgi:type I restriction enzyme S subunit
MSFPRYPEYKDSGVEWLGSVPAHWEVKRLRQLGPLLKGSGGSKEDVVEDGVPCVRYGDLYTTHSFFIREARSCVAEAKAADYTPIRQGDVLFAASGEKMAEIGKSAVNLMSSTAYCGGDLILFRPTVVLNLKFIGYACDCNTSNVQKASMGRGTTIKHIYPDELKRLALTIPPLPEQVRIAAFLDAETAKIDALIHEQQRLMELLKEKRQAVISHCVTKGLSQGAPMKDSGVEWLGEVPAHWELRRLRWLFRPAKRQGHVGKDVLSVYRDYGVITKDSRDDNMNKTPDDLSLYQLVNPNDLVVNKMKAWQGSLGISDVEGITSPDYAVFTPSHHESSSFLHMLLRCDRVVSVYRGISNGIRPSQWRLEPDSFLALHIAIPPRQEQERVALFVTKAIAQFDALTAEAQRAIDLLQERRTALISAAVTGQIDVRTIAERGAA